MGTIIHSFDRVLDRNLPVAPFGTMTSLPVRTNGSVAAEEAAAGANGIASRAEAPRWRNDSEGGWVVQKFGGTSVGKFAVNIAEDIVRASLKDNKIAVVCSARSTGKKVEGTTSRLLEVFGVLEECGEVSILNKMATLSLVGAEMKNMIGIAGRMFSTLGENNVNIEMISQGASEINISCVINAYESTRAMNILHTNLFTFLES